MIPDIDRLPVRRPWRVVPRLGRRWLGDPSADELAFWTIQPEPVYRAIVETGEALPDPAFAEPDFKDAYAWMARHADERLSTSGRGLFWVWAKAEPRTIRDCAKHARGEILMTLKIPAERVLLSEFDGWHMVLNEGYNVAPLPGEDDNAWWERIDRLMDDFDARAEAARRQHGTLTEELRLEREATWDSIFDPSIWRPEQTIQGVVHSIRADQVVDAVRIS